MPYEIPQNLKYQEKIVFGLTFWQLFWLSLFCGLSAVIFFKTPLILEIKLLLVIVLLGMYSFAVLLAFITFFIRYLVLLIGVVLFPIGIFSSLF